MTATQLEEFTKEVADFMTLTGVSASRLSRETIKDPTFVSRLLAGKANPTVATMDKVRDWMDMYEVRRMCE